MAVLEKDGFSPGAQCRRFPACLVAVAPTLCLGWQRLGLQKRKVDLICRYSELF